MEENSPHLLDLGSDTLAAVLKALPVGDVLRCSQVSRDAMKVAGLPQTGLPRLHGAALETSPSLTAAP